MTFWHCIETDNYAFNPAPYPERWIMDMIELGLRVAAWMEEQNDVS